MNRALIIFATLNIFVRACPPLNAAHNSETLPGSQQKPLEIWRAGTPVIFGSDKGTGEPSGPLQKKLAISLAGHLLFLL